MKLLVEIELSDDVEGTSYPWWMIVDPVQNMSKDPAVAVMNQITGPFFSREEADRVFQSTRYRYGAAWSCWLWLARTRVVLCCNGFKSIGPRAK